MKQLPKVIEDPNWGMKGIEDHLPQTTEDINLAREDRIFELGMQLATALTIIGLMFAIAALILFK